MDEEEGLAFSANDIMKIDPIDMDYLTFKTRRGRGGCCPVHRRCCCLSVCGLLCMDLCVQQYEEEDGETDRVQEMMAGRKTCRDFHDFIIRQQNYPARSGTAMFKQCCLL